MPIMLLEGSATLDTGVVTSLVDLVKSVMGLFTEFPLNFILVAGLIGVAFTIFSRARGAAGGV